MPVKCLIIVSKNGTTLVRLDTMEAWLNKNRPLTFVEDDNGVIWPNAPCSLKAEEWKHVRYPYIAMTFNSDSFDSELRNKAAEKDPNIYIETNGPNCLCCGAHDRGLHGYPCIHCGFDIKDYL